MQNDILFLRVTSRKRTCFRFEPRVTLYGTELADHDIIQVTAATGSAPGAISIFQCERPVCPSLCNYTRSCLDHSSVSRTTFYSISCISLLSQFDSRCTYPVTHRTFPLWGC